MEEALDFINGDEIRRGLLDRSMFKHIASIDSAQVRGSKGLTEVASLSVGDILEGLDAQLEGLNNVPEDVAHMRVRVWSAFMQGETLDLEATFGNNASLMEQAIDFQAALYHR